ncbi:hypothetical protein C8Q78DRAFT_1081430 [Trametes maxima]|nr:hypothetical protein C8Q78DRAFT_1081430 [Trametes maxima]
MEASKPPKPVSQSPGGSRMSAMGLPGAEDTSIDSSTPARGDMYAVSLPYWVSEEQER